MDMIFNYPDYFAAAYPICEAYMDAGITDEQLEAIKDLPIWFVYAENDTTVDPSTFEVPTIERLRSLGADVHTSVFADVHDTSGNYIGEDGSAYQFMGHWSWIYFFNNQCEENGVNLWQWLAQQSK
jgi:predicted peptidase